MPAQLNGRAAVAQLEDRLNAAFDRARALDPSLLELRADLARYLVIRVAGFLEKAVSELTIEVTRQRSDSLVLGFTSNRLRRLQNLSTARILDLLGEFSST